jgi:hypothetical protein
MDIPVGLSPVSMGMCGETHLLDGHPVYIGALG